MTFAIFVTLVRAAKQKKWATGQKVWARTDMDYGGNRRISYDFSLILL